MANEILEVKRDRFHLEDPHSYIIQGNFLEGYEAEAWLDKEQVPVHLETWEATSVWDRYEMKKQGNLTRVTATVTLPDNLADYKTLNVYAVKGAKKVKWHTLPAPLLAKLQGRPQFFVESYEYDKKEKICRIRGWAVHGSRVKFVIRDNKGNKLPFKLQRHNRKDVEDFFPEAEIERKCGFFIEIPDLKTTEIRIKFLSASSSIVTRLHLGRMAEAKRKVGNLTSKSIGYLRTYGLVRFLQKVTGKAASIKNKPIDYETWLSRHLPPTDVLEEQRKTSFENSPLISVVVPLYKTPEDYLRALVTSLQEQTYPNWELCLSDGSGPDSPLQNVLQELQAGDRRIKVVSHETPLKIAENTNAAINIAAGDYIAFADHDDALTADALFENVKLLNERPELQLIYSDEDKMSMDGHKHFQPHMKPDYNPDLLHTVNYICHFLVVKRELIDRVGMLSSDFDGAQDYDFILRCVEEAGESRIGHVPRILYHWRSHEDSTSENPESKLYAFDAGERALQAHFDRLGVPVEIYKGEYLGLYRTRYKWPEQPLVSIIIPNKDHTDDLERCISSIEDKCKYPNLEYIVVENNSTEAETFRYYKELERRNPRVRVITWEREFNYSAINNFGIKEAKGDYILLLNNDTELISDDGIEELLGYCMRSDVGAVGARMYYEDSTIQHAGVVIGFGGIAGHCFVQQPQGFTGYMHRIISAQNYSAVTAACMMIKRSAFEEVGGLTEELAVAFNDIDFCLKLRKAGYLIVYNPYCELFHYESKSRGLEDTPEKLERFHREVDIFNDRWPEILEKGDPYYNPNLTLESQDFSLKRI